MSKGCQGDKAAVRVLGSGRGAVQQARGHTACTCEVAELGDEHGGSRQRAARAPPPLGLADQNWLFQVGDFLVVLLFKGRKVLVLG